MCLGYQKTRGFSHSHFFRFRAKLLVVELARCRRRGDLPFCAIHLDVGGSDIDFHELGKVLQGFLGLFPGKKSPPVERFRIPVQKRVIEAEAAFEVEAVFVHIADGLAERICVPAFSQRDEEIEQRQQSVFRFDQLQIPSRNFQPCLV